MTASRETVKRVVQVLEKYVQPNEVQDLLKDLASIPGNKSFTDTVKMISKQLKEETS